MNKNDAPMVLIEPLPIEWEIDPVLNNVWECVPTGKVATCTSGSGTE